MVQPNEMEKIGVKFYKRNQGRYFNALKDHIETTSYKTIWRKKILLSFSMN